MLNGEQLKPFLMTIHLTNSAVMTRPGVYTCKELSAQQFYGEISGAWHLGTLKTYIGYTQNRDLIRRNTGLNFPLSRAETILEPGDVILAMVLKYRTDGIKGRDVDPNEFQFFYITFKKN